MKEEVMSDTETTASKVESMQLRPRGTAILHFDATIEPNEIKQIMNQQGCIFRFEFMSADIESGQCRIKLVPDNGMVRVINGQKVE